MSDSEKPFGGNDLPEEAEYQLSEEEIAEEKEMNDMPALIQAIYNDLLMRGVMEKYHLPLDDKYYEKDEAERLAMEKEVIASMVIRVADDAEFETGYLDDIIRSLGTFEETCRGITNYDDDIFESVLDVLIEIISRDMDRKIALKEEKGSKYTLDLNREIKLLEDILKISYLNEDAYALLGRAGKVLKREDMVQDAIDHDGEMKIGEYIMLLTEQGKYRQAMDEWRKHGPCKLYDGEGECVIKSRIKTACFIDFDERGMPFTNDSTPQFLWADLNSYRGEFSNAASRTCDEFFARMRGKYADKQENRQELPRLAVAAQLQVMKRASVAELMRKLVNGDLQFGEGNNVNSTRAGLFSGDLDVNYIRMIFRQFGSDFKKSAVSVDEMFAPVKVLLTEEAGRFRLWLEDLLKDKFGGKIQYETYGPRVKDLFSILQKMLKNKKPGEKDWTAVLDVTDLIGATVLTDTEAEVDEIYAELEKLMIPGTIKGHDMWEKETSRGRKSKDITGMIPGFPVKVQVQCRTKKMEELYNGRLSHHLSYKKFSGEKLQKNINENPNAYLDLLYQALHNMRMAFEECGGMSKKGEQAMVPDAKKILEAYSKNYADGFSIIRTFVLY